MLTRELGSSTRQVRGRTGPRESLRADLGLECIGGRDQAEVELLKLGAEAGGLVVKEELAELADPCGEGFNLAPLLGRVLAVGKVTR